MVNIAGAREAGYSDDEIVAALEKKGGFNIAGAREAGHSSADILNAIAKRRAPAATESQETPSVFEGIQQSIASVPSGVGKTLEHFSPAKGTAKSLQETGASIAPENYKPAHVVNDDWSVNAGELPRAVAEQSVPMAGGIALARLLARRFGMGAIPASLAGMGGVTAATQLGEQTENRAKEMGEETPSLATKATAAGFMVPQMAAEVIPGVRQINAGRALTASGAAKNLAGLGAREATEGAIQSGVEQTGRTIGSDKGIRIDPVEAANAAAVGAAAGPVMGAGRAARDINDARAFRDFDPAVAEQVANDIRDTATSLGNSREGHGAVHRTETIYREDLRSAASDFRAEAGIERGEANGILSRAERGESLTERDFNILSNIAEGTTSGPGVIDLARRINTINQLKTLGNFSDAKGTFRGGAGDKLERGLWWMVNPAKGAALGALGAAGVGYAAPGAIAAAPATMAASIPMWGLTRMVDRVMGTRLPAKRFVERYASDAPARTPRPGAPPAQPMDLNEFESHLQPGPADPREFESHLRPQLPAVIRRGPTRRAADNTIYQGAPEPQRMLPPPGNTPDGPSSAFPQGAGPAMQMPGGLPMLPPPTPGAPIWAGAPEPQRLLPPPGPPTPGPSSAFPQEVLPPIAMPGAKAPSNVINRMKLLAALRAREEAEDVPHVPIVNDGPASIDTTRPLSMAEELDREAVISSLKKGANTFGEIRRDAEMDAESLNRVLSRLSAEGVVKRDGAGVKLVQAEKPAVPAAVRAKAKAGAPAQQGWARDLMFQAAANMTPEQKDSVRANQAKIKANTAIIRENSKDIQRSLAEREANREDRLASISTAGVRAAMPPSAFPAPQGDGLDIPDFLNRRLQPPPAAATAAPAPAPINPMVAALAQEGPALSGNFVSGNRDKTIENVLARFAQEQGYDSVDRIWDGTQRAPSGKPRPNIRGGIVGRVNQKLDIMDAIGKEVPGFDTDDASARFLDALTTTRGTELRTFLKGRYPKFDEVFDRHLSDEAFGKLFTRKTSKRDGTRKAKSK